MSKLLSGLGTRAAHPLAYLPLPQPVGVDCEIKDYQVLGSYNWLDAGKQSPTIVIPGQPRIWQEPVLPLQLALDQGYTFIDQNAWRCRASPLEPIFRSIEVSQQIIGNTSFSLSELQADVVTDRNNLRKLSAMVGDMRSNANLAPSKNREFRIDAQLAPNGRTLLLTRYSKELRRMISHGGAGYGANFEHATTISNPISLPNQGRRESGNFLPTSYHRIARYSLAHLNLVVRYEVDAALGTPLIDGPHVSTYMNTSYESKVETRPDSTLRHFVSGSLVPQDRIMELKTSVSNKKLSWKKVRPQLYFSKTTILKAGFHEKGTFSRIDDHSIDQNYTGPAVENNQDFADSLRSLVPMLEQMRDTCRQYGQSGRPLAFFWSGAGPLQLYEIEHPMQTRMLPGHILESL